MADVRELSTDPAVKLSGVAALSTDNAMVVSLSPNSPTPAGANNIGSVGANTAIVSAVVVMQNAVAATGNGTSLTVTGYGTTVLQVSGTFVATVNFEASVDAGVTWTAISATQVGAGDIFSVVTTPGVFRLTTTGLDLIRARVTWTSGTSITINGRSNNAINASKIVKLATSANTIGATNVNTANVSAVTVLQNAVAVTGNGTNLPVTGYGTVVLQVSGTFVATINFEASVDAGVTWTSISATQVGFGDIFSVVTTPGVFRLTTTGLDLIRARVTWTSGTSITINGRSTNAINASKIVKLATSTNSIGTVQQAAIIKSTQGTTGVTTQDLKDSGRVNVAMTCYQAAGIITTEALFAATAFSFSRDGAAATTGQQLAVTATKRFAIQSIVVSIKNTAAAAGTSKLALRYQAAGGAITNTSPILAILDLGSNSVTANAYIGPTEIALPDSMELIANSTFGFTNLSSAATMLHTITVNGFEY